MVSPISSTSAQVSPSISAHRRRRRKGGAQFAHPAEEYLAELLTFYGVAWDYEPTTFPLVNDQRGFVTTAFTPDFHLPEHKRYIEVTTMRQPLVTRKNRKLRLLRETYPEIDVRLLYRRDIARLTEIFAKNDAQADEVGDLVYNGRELRSGIHDMVAKLRMNPAIYQGRPIVLALGEESTVLAREVTAIPPQGFNDWDEDTLLSTPFILGGAKHVAFTQRAGRSVEGRTVILLASRVFTGLRLNAASSWLADQGAASVVSCALLHRSDATIVDVDLSHVVAPAPDGPIAGFGIGSSSTLAALDGVYRIHSRT